MKITVATFITLIGFTANTGYGAPQEQGYNYLTPTTPTPPSYSYGYTVDEVDNERQPVKFGHQESRSGPQTTGTYYVLLPDGRVMTVNYYADETGFHPTYSFQGQASYQQAAAPAAPTQLYSPPSGGQAALATPQHQQQVVSLPAAAQVVLVRPRQQAISLPAAAQAVLAAPRRQQQQVSLPAAAQVVRATPQLQYSLPAAVQAILAEPSQLYHTPRG